ncbi:MAG: MarR family winged helix-turn-helix transcriptional regulator [Ilumatobacteraceae bacterium]
MAPKSKKSVKQPALDAVLAGRLGDQLCFALYSATNAMTRAYRPLLAEIGLTYPQYLVLLVLWERQSCRLGEIADELRLATHAVSPIIDRLEEAGAVKRVEDATDGRAVKVELTKAGLALEAKVADVQDQMRCRTSLDAAAVDDLRETITALVESLDEWLVAD